MDKNREHLKAVIGRELIRMINRGEAVYDPETKRYTPRRVVDEEVARGEDCASPPVGRARA